MAPSRRNHSIFLIFQRSQQRRSLLERKWLTLQVLCFGFIHDYHFNGNQPHIDSRTVSLNYFQLVLQFAYDCFHTWFSLFPSFNVHLWTEYTVLFVMLTLLIPCFWVTFIWEEIIDPHYESENIPVPENRVLRFFYGISRPITEHLSIRTIIYIVISSLFVTTAVTDVVSIILLHFLVSFSYLSDFSYVNDHTKIISLLLKNSFYRVWVTDIQLHVSNEKGKHSSFIDYFDSKNYPIWLQVTAKACLLESPKVRFTNYIRDYMKMSSMVFCRSKVLMEQYM